jgi:molecular chaperone GrpE (heat shock protein)
MASINIKVESFNSKMYRIINDEFKNLRERVMFIIDESFKESEKYIREYMKTQEEKLAGDLIKMKDSLQKEFTKIEAMKEEIGKPNWRKVAGEIIASELERRVDELVKVSGQLTVGRWELGDLVGYRLKDL